MHKYVSLLAVTGLASLPAVGMAAAPSVSDILGSSGISAQGYFSGGYTGGFNHGQTLAGHAFDTNSNTFALNQADLALGYQPASGAGGLVEVMAGNDARTVNASYSDSSSSDSEFALAQGFVQYAAGNLTVIGGRYWTMAGEEVADDGKNTNISRSFLFDVVEPLAHTGVRGTWKFSDKLSGSLGVANSAVSGEALAAQKPKTAEANLTLTPSSTTTFGLTDYYGVDGDPQRNNYLDGVASFNITSALQMALNADWHKYTPVGAPGAASVYGGAGYLNYTFSNSFKGSLRGEYLKGSGGALGDPNGDGKSSLSEVTLTGDYTVAKNLDLFAEARYDMGDKVYPDPGTVQDPSLASHQSEVELRAIYKFGTPTS